MKIVILTPRVRPGKVTENCDAILGAVPSVAADWIFVGSSAISGGDLLSLSSLYKSEIKVAAARLKENVPQIVVGDETDGVVPVVVKNISVPYTAGVAARMEAALALESKTCQLPIVALGSCEGETTEGGALFTNSYIYYKGVQYGKKMGNCVVADVPCGFAKNPYLEFTTGEEAFQVAVSALSTRLGNIGVKKVVLGVSGGLDSTMALLVAVKAFEKSGLDKKGIVAVTMPGFGTSSRTHGNALALMEALGVTVREVDITAACRRHLQDIDHDLENHNVTYENAQARERTQVLFDISNDIGAIVLGTGDLSESALGWCTYGGDQFSSYCINGGIPKTVIQEIVLQVSDTVFTDVPALKGVLRDIIDTPISPELLPPTTSGEIAQQTQSIVGPYALHDFFIYYLLKYNLSREGIYYLACRAFEGEYSSREISDVLDIFFTRLIKSQFKRVTSAPSPMIFEEVAFSACGGYYFPSDLS